MADPPYGLGKDYGNDSDMLSGEAFLDWTYGWLDLAIPKLKPTGSLYIFCTWQYSPELFVFLKTPAHDGQRDRLGPARAEHGRNDA